ncbi:hypothetical protein V5O48_005819 [Marasmius crinis-equi]|uniref:Uncharacterized protein n=1 Tax=Marasmius crinis-equi TaxID=585013 RepID=A0ABR3FLF3_9AGAR
MSLRLAIARSRKPVSRVKLTKTGKWSEEEDQKLLKGVRLYGDDWTSIASKIVETRTAAQCISRWARVWSPEEDMGLKRGFNDHGAKFVLFGHGPDALLFRFSSNISPSFRWLLISKLYVPSRTAEECRKRWKLHCSKRSRGSPPLDNQPELTPNCGASSPRGKSRDGAPHCPDLSSTNGHAPEHEKNHKSPLPVVTEDTFACTEIDTSLLDSFDLTPPPLTETLNAFRKREAENLVQIARKLRELHNTSASAMQSRADQLEKHTRMFEEGFSQLDEIQRSLQLVSHQPIPAVPQEKLGHLASAVQSSESRIRALETSLSRLEKQKQGHPSGPYPSASQARAPASMAATSPVPPRPEQRPNVPCHYEPKEYGGLPTHPLYRVYTSPVQQFASFYPRT